MFIAIQCGGVLNYERMKCWRNKITNSLNCVLLRFEVVSNCFLRLKECSTIRWSQLFSQFVTWESDTVDTSRWMYRGWPPDILRDCVFPKKRLRLREHAFDRSLYLSHMVSICKIGEFPIPTRYFILRFLLYAHLTSLCVFISLHVSLPNFISCTLPQGNVGYEVGVRVLPIRF